MELPISTLDFSRFVRENELELMSTMRPGLIQLEIGVQSTNPDTIRAIHRTMDFPKLAGIVNRIHSFKNIHQHEKGQPRLLS